MKKKCANWPSIKNNEYCPNPPSANTKPGQPFALELASGRVIQIYDPRTVSTSEAGYGSIGVLHSDGAFEVFGAIHVVSVSVGVHPVETERFKELKERATKPLGRET